MKPRHRLRCVCFCLLRASALMSVSLADGTQEHNASQRYGFLINKVFSSNSTALDWEFSMAGSTAPAVVLQSLIISREPGTKPKYSLQGQESPCRRQKTRFPHPKVTRFLRMDPPGRLQHRTEDCSKLSLSDPKVVLQELQKTSSPTRKKENEKKEQRKKASEEKEEMA